MFVSTPSSPSESEKKCGQFKDTDWGTNKKIEIYIKKKQNSAECEETLVTLSASGSWAPTPSQRRTRDLGALFGL